MNDDIVALAKLRLEEILSFYGLNVSVKAVVNESAIELSVETDSTGHLIGRHGETLAALQQLLNAIVRAHTTEHVYVSLDIGEYKKGRADQLSEQAHIDAKNVIETGTIKRLRPMTPAERRIVHMALADYPEIATESEGEGRERRVVIKRRKTE